MKCPLCEEKNLDKIEIINKKQLIFLYKKMINIDISTLIDKDLDYYKCINCELQFFDPLISGDEKFYNALQKLDWYYIDEKEEYNSAKNYIKSTDKLLEIGGGKGSFVKYLPTKNYTGIEFSTKAREMAAKNNIKMENELIQNYVKKKQNFFDVVVSFQVLEHVSDPKNFIEAKLRALKIGGKMIITVPSEDSFLKYVTNGLFNMPPHHVTRWNDKTFHFLSKKYELKIINIYHEKVQDIHKTWYISTFIQNSLLKQKMIDLSIKRKFFNKFSNFLSRILKKGIKEEMLPNGHTVLIVMEKLNNNFN